VSEAELREWEDGQEAEELGSGGTTTVLAHARLHGVCVKGIGEGALFLCFSLLSIPL